MGATAADGTEGVALIRQEVVDSGLQHQAGCFGSFVQAAAGDEAGDIHQPVALPQELQAAMQRTLKVLAEPEAPLFPTAP
ncbi:hypothetical protein HaLaN_18168, partial [Haematococcus lacustris]